MYTLYLIILAYFRFTMPGHRCAVSTCNNSKVSVKKQGLDIIFHSFPKATTPEGLNIRNQWIDFCNRDTLNATNANICSIHFTKDDYERDLKNELLGFNVDLIKFGLLTFRF